MQPVPLRRTPRTDGNRGDRAREARAIAERLRTACAGQTYAQLARATGFHPETIRRYLLGQSPDVAFVAAIARAMGYAPCWLVAGIGEPRAADAIRAALASATTTELMAELSARQVSGLPLTCADAPPMPEVLASIDGDSLASSASAS